MNETKIERYERYIEHSILRLSRERDDLLKTSAIFELHFELTQAASLGEESASRLFGKHTNVKTRTLGLKDQSVELLNELKASGPHFLKYQQELEELVRKSSAMYDIQSIVCEFLMINWLKAAVLGTPIEKIPDSISKLKSQVENGGAGNLTSKKLQKRDLMWIELFERRLLDENSKY